jgi:hypothetical protein
LRHLRHELAQAERKLRELFGPNRWANQYGSGPRGFEGGLTPVELAGIVKATGSNAAARPFIDLDAMSEYINMRIHRAVAHMARNRYFG